MFLEDVLEKELLNNKEQVYEIFKNFYPPEKGYEYINLEKNENEFVDAKNKIDFYLTIRNNKTNKTLKFGIDLKQKSGRMGKSMSGSFIDFPIGNQKGTSGYVDASYNSPFALNKFNLFSLIKTDLPKNDFVKRYNSNNNVDLELAVVKNNDIKIYLENIMNNDGEPLYNKLRNESLSLIQLYNKPTQVIKNYGIDVFTRNDKKTISKKLFPNNDIFKLIVKKDPRGKVNAIISAEYDKLKELNLLYDNIKKGDKKDGRKKEND